LTELYLDKEDDLLDFSRRVIFARTSSNRTVDSDDDFVHVSQHPLDEDDEADYDEIEEEQERSGSEEEGF